MRWELKAFGGGTRLTLWSDIETLRAWLAPQAAIQLMYAATEAPMMQWFVDDTCRRDDARIPIGYPLPGNRLAIIDHESTDNTRALRQNATRAAEISVSRSRISRA